MRVTSSKSAGDEERESKLGDLATTSKFFKRYDMQYLLQHNISKSLTTKKKYNDRFEKYFFN